MKKGFNPRGIKITCGFSDAMLSALEHRFEKLLILAILLVIIGLLQ